MKGSTGWSLFSLYYIIDTVCAIVLARLCHSIDKTVPQAWQKFANAVAKTILNHFLTDDYLKQMTIFAL